MTTNIKYDDDNSIRGIKQGWNEFYNFLRKKKIFIFISSLTDISLFNPYNKIILPYMLILLYKSAINKFPCKEFYNLIKGIY